MPVRARLKDHRGRECELFSYWEDPKVAPERARQVRAKVKEASSQNWIVGLLTLIVVCDPGCLMFLALVGLIALVEFVFGFGPYSTKSLWIALAVLGVIMLLIYRYVHDLTARRTRCKAILEAACCASCGYDLDGSKPEPDGCTVCPECGAAWRLGEEGTKARRHEGTEG